MEKHIDLCRSNDKYKVPSMSEYSSAREIFLAPVRREYSEVIRDYPPAIQQMEHYSSAHGFGYGTLAWTLCCSGMKVTCKVCPESFTVDPSTRGSG
eukprot:3486020-Karenia_brevis.AAC.1